MMIKWRELIDDINNDYNSRNRIIIKIGIAMTEGKKLLDMLILSKEIWLPPFPQKI